MATKALMFDGNTNSISNVTDSLNFPEGFELKIGGIKFAGQTQDAIDDATENLTIVTAKLNELLESCRNYGLLSRTDLSSSSSNSSDSSSSSNSNSSDT